MCACVCLFIGLVLHALHCLRVRTVTSKHALWIRSSSPMNVTSHLLDVLFISSTIPCRKPIVTLLIVYFVLSFFFYVLRFVFFFFVGCVRFRLRWFAECFFSSSGFFVLVCLLRVIIHIADRGQTVTKRSPFCFATTFLHAPTMKNDNHNKPKTNKPPLENSLYGVTSRTHHHHQQPSPTTNTHVI